MSCIKLDVLCPKGLAQPVYPFILLPELVIENDKDRVDLVMTSGGIRAVGIVNFAGCGACVLLRLVGTSKLSRPRLQTCGQPLLLTTRCASLQQKTSCLERRPYAHWRCSRCTIRSSYSMGMCVCVCFLWFCPITFCRVHMFPYGDLRTPIEL